MGEIVKAGLLRPVDRLREGLRLGGPLLADAARPQQVLARRQGVRLRRPVRALADGRDRRRLLQQGRRSPTPPTTLAEFEASLQEAKDAGETPIMFGNLEKWPGIHNFETRARADRRQAGDPRLRVRQGGRVVRQRRSSRPAPTKIKEWVDKGYFNKNFNGTDYDPAWQAFAKGKSRYLIAGTWVTADLAEADGRQRRLHADAGQRSERAGRRSAARSLPCAITSAAKNPDVAAAYIDFLTDANAAKVLVDTDNLPAMKDAPAPAERRVGRGRQRVAEAQRGRRRDPVPGLHDADVLRRHQRRDPGAAGAASRTRRSSPQGVQEEFDKWAESR